MDRAHPYSAVPRTRASCVEMYIRHRLRPERVFFLALASILAVPATAADNPLPHAFTFYAGRISAEETWHDVLIHPFSKHYTDTYIVAGSYSRAFAEYRDGGLRREAEVNLAYNHGGQDHWELNVVPITLRWMRFPWSEHVHTTAAFGLGLSYAFGRPDVEYELENDSQRLLLYWLLEFTAGPREGPWSAVIRLHHRSPGWGAMGIADGGMNAPSIGFRYEF